MHLEIRLFKLGYNSKEKEFSLAIQKKEFSPFGTEPEEFCHNTPQTFYVGYQLYVEA